MSEYAYSERMRLARIRRYSIAENEIEDAAARKDRDADRYQIVDEWLAEDDAPRVHSEHDREEAKQ